jgi:hypothetical protein
LLLLLCVCRLHIIGTSIVLLIAAFHPAMIAAALIAGGLLACLLLVDVASPCHLVCLS